MMERPLPDRRETQRQKAIIGGQKIYLDCGFYDDGTIGEIFIVLRKTGAHERWMMDEMARLASKLLQHGCSLEDLAEGWLGAKGTPCGPVQGHAKIKNCTSILDFVARHLLIEWCDRDDLSHVKKETV
jgi:hypothetical protein